jgi:hypothetical protein
VSTGGEAFLLTDLLNNQSTYTLAASSDIQQSVPAVLHIQLLLQVIQQMADGANLSPRSLLINP